MLVIIQMGHIIFHPIFYQALQEARMTTTNTLVAMEEEDDFDDPMTPTPVKGLFNDIRVCIYQQLVV